MTKVSAFFLSIGVLSISAGIAAAIGSVPGGIITFGIFCLLAPIAIRTAKDF